MLKLSKLLLVFNPRDESQPQVRGVEDLGTTQSLPFSMFTTKAA